MGKSRMGISQIFSGHKNDSSSSRIKQPLVISSPIGPVKNSRGPDLTRSAGLIIVNAINDCAQAQDNDGVQTSATPITEKKTAISIFARKTLLKTQSLASLSSPAKDAVPTPGTTPRSKFEEELTSTLSKLKIASESTTTVFTDNGEYTHTTRPPHLASPPTRKPTFATRLPKSKTMNVLQDIKNSAPRRTTALDSIPKPQTKLPETPLKQSEMPIRFLFRSLRRASQEDSISSSRHSSTTNITTPDSSGQMNDATESLPRPGQIIHAQPSAYWTGRFTALRDRLSSEHMAHVLAQATDTIQMGVQDASRRRRHADIELCEDPPYLLRDEDDLCRQVFSILESQCITTASRESLRRWRENYAFIRRRPNLRPGFSGDLQISRRFASHARHCDELGLNFLEEAYYSNASNAFGMTNPNSLEGRYLNFR